MSKIDFLQATTHAVEALDKAKAAVKFSEEAKESAEEAAFIFSSALAAAESATKKYELSEANADSDEKYLISAFNIVQDAIKYSSQNVISNIDIKNMYDDIDIALARNIASFYTADIAYSEARSAKEALVKADAALTKANEALTKAEADSDLALTFCENAVKKATDRKTAYYAILQPIVVSI
jgi:hypothetical protein